MNQHRWPRLLTYLLVALCVLTTSRCAPPDANAAALPAGVRVEATVAPGDTVRLVVRWTLTPVTDGLGPIEGVRLTVTRSTPAGLAPAVQTLSATATTGTALLPTGLAAPGTVTGTACVQTVRRGALSPQTCAPWSATWADAPPPAPGPVTVDTARVLSIVLRPETVTVAAAATQQFCAFARMSDGKVRGVTLADGTTTASRPFCLNGYATWFPLAERTPVLELARTRDWTGRLVAVRVA